VFVQVNLVIEQIEIQFDQAIVSAGLFRRDARRRVLLVAMNAFLIGLGDGADLVDVALTL